MEARTIVITTKEECDAWLSHFDRVKVAVRENDYASERAKPVRSLSCTCCGGYYRGRQWWNQDAGHGLGDCCVDYCHVDRTPGVETETYGVAGIHFLIEA